MSDVLKTKRLEAIKLKAIKTKAIKEKSTDGKFEMPAWVLPLLLMVLGAVLRLVYLGSVPGGMHQDESFVALNAFGMYHEGRDSAGLRFPVYMSSWGDGQSAMYIWLLTPLLGLKGGHVDALLCRIPQAVVAIVTLWAVYCLVKRLFHRRMALWSLFLLAICPWHIMMSRWGLDANLAPGFLIFGLYFFVRGLEKHQYLLLSALFYGLSLYCYAVIWPIVPILLALQALYGLFVGKLKINGYSLFAVGILFVLALPLVLFLLVNYGVLPQIELPFLTIPKTSGYRGTELAGSLRALWENLLNTYRLLRYQDTGSAYDVLMPWGMFYDLGRVFIVVGVLWLLWNWVRRIWKKNRDTGRRIFVPETILLIQLFGGLVTGLLVKAHLHQLNNLYIPLVICEAYGVSMLLEKIRGSKQKVNEVAEKDAASDMKADGKKSRDVRKVFAGFTGGILAVMYLVCLVLFQRDYYTDYKVLVSNYFAIGVEACVEYSMEQCKERGIDTITVEKGAQWPRLLLYTETLPSEYFEAVEYDVAPAPASFVTKNIRINTRIDYDGIDTDSIYIIYYTDVPEFEQDFELTKFYDWYVAVPR